MPNERDPRVTRVGSPKANENDFRVIGVPRRRVDARAKVTGQTRFADDISCPEWRSANFYALLIPTRASEESTRLALSLSLECI